jgi:hypothetical protein
MNGRERAMSSRGRVPRFFLLAAAALLAPGGAATAAPTPQPAAAKKPSTHENDWPRQIQLGETTVLLDAPQAESLEGTKLRARGTARVQRPGESEPSFGTIWYEAEVRSTAAGEP